MILVVKGQHICTETVEDVYRREEDWDCVMTFLMETMPEMRNIYVVPDSICGKGHTRTRAISC